MKTARTIGIVLLASLHPAALAGQVPPPARDARTAASAPQGTGVIAGALTTIDSTRAVRQARVTLSGVDVRFARSVTTDDQGGFAFTDLPAGQFTLTASKPGYLEVIYGQRVPGAGRPGTPIQLHAGERRDRIALQIPRAGVVTGTIVDEFGDPILGLQVRASRFVMRTGERSLVPAGSASTDDRGVYRIPGLLPGEYLISTQPKDPTSFQVTVEMKKRAEEVMDAANARGLVVEAMVAEAKAVAAMAEMSSAADDAPAGYAPVFYPGTPQASAATSIALGVGEERASLDFRLQLVKLARISGRVIAGGAGAPAGTQAFLVDSTQPPALAALRSSRVTPDGSFTFAGVPPGQYTLFARATMRAGGETALPTGPPGSKEAAIAAAMNPPQTETLWASSDIAVSGDPLPNLVLTLQPGMSVSGTVAFDGAPAGAVDLSRLRVAVVPVAGVPGGELALTRDAVVDASGRFTIRGALPGRYRVVPATGVPSGFTIESAVFGGRDVLDFPLDVLPGQDQTGGVLTFSTRISEISGTVTSPSGAPVSDLTIVAFPADSRYWAPQARRIQAMRPATDGRFAFRLLPAGEYRLVAIADPEPGQWYDPDFLRQLVGASIAVPLGPGEKRRQDVTLKPGGGPSTR